MAKNDTNYTQHAIMYSVALGFVIFMAYLTLYSLNLFNLKSIASSWAVFILYSIEAIPFCFLILSCWHTRSMRNTSYISTYGIGKHQSIAITSASICYCRYPIFLLIEDYKVLYNIAFIAMIALEIIVALYAGYDMINNLNLRWFLRTFPYCVTGICFIAYAMIEMFIAHKSIFQNNDSLANAILSFVTITYFVQVFNERFCKKQDD